METFAGLTLSVFDIARLSEDPWVVTGPFQEGGRDKGSSTQVPELYEGERLDGLSDRMMLLVLQRRGRMSLLSISGERIGLCFYAGSERWDIATDAGSNLGAEFAKRLADPKRWSWERAGAISPA